LTKIESVKKYFKQFTVNHQYRSTISASYVTNLNYTQDQQGRPVLYDPACYWGDREADLAMTELFGGFGPDFYAAYQSEYPLDPGYGVRKYLYNLYHILNHLNMFGGGYQAQALQMMERLLAEV
ncbi:MAG: fructosamine kinase family protein, partial [Methylococcaceae bacterium]|nr:fructosamine kinase family protein [Methylococcaceae bacterium]